MDGGSIEGGGRKLTKFQVDHVKPRGDRFELSDGRSALRLVVQPSGQKSWAIRYRVGNRTRKHTLGKCPPLSLKDARELARKSLGEVARGGDPAAAKRAERERRNFTVRAAVDDYITKWQEPRNKTVTEVKRDLNRLLVDKFGSRDIREVSRADVSRALSAANRRRIAVVKAFFTWCVRANIIEVSPAVAIHSDAPIVSRDRVLTDDELRAFFAAIGDLGEPWTSLYELIALTAQRRSEVSKAPRAEFDTSNAAWTIAPERAKNDHGHIVPLAPRALEIVKKLRGNNPEGFLFPAERGGEGAVSGFSRAKERLDRLMLVKLREMAQARGDDPAKVKLSRWVIHDLRRTAATRMASLGHPIHVVERILNHVAGTTTGGLVAIYQRHDYLAERRAALEAWSEHLRTLRDE